MRRKGHTLRTQGAAQLGGRSHKPMKKFSSLSANPGSSRELRVALPVDVYDHIQRLARLRRCSPARVVELAMRDHILAEAVERLLTRVDVVDAQLEAIAGALVATGRARR